MQILIDSDAVILQHPQAYAPSALSSPDMHSFQSPPTQHSQ